MSTAPGLAADIVRQASLIVDETAELLGLLQQLQVMAMESEAMTTKIRMARLLCATTRARAHSLHSSCGAANVCGYVLKPEPLPEPPVEQTPWLPVQVPPTRQIDRRMAAANDDTFRD
jgi:hypothetical protein